MSNASIDSDPQLLSELQMMVNIASGVAKHVSGAIDKSDALFYDLDRIDEALPALKRRLVLGSIKNLIVSSMLGSMQVAFNYLNSQDIPLTLDSLSYLFNSPFFKHISSSMRLFVNIEVPFSGAYPACPTIPVEVNGVSSIDQSADMAIYIGTANDYYGVNGVCPFGAKIATNSVARASQMAETLNLPNHAVEILSASIGQTGIQAYTLLMAKHILPIVFVKPQS
jgi:hypothetical protein